MVRDELDLIYLVGHWGSAARENFTRDEIVFDEEREE